MDILTYFFDKAKTFLMSVLPLSPFRQFLNEFAVISATKLGWLNWLIPVRQMLVVMAAWLSAITVYYLYSIIMRWAKIIGD